MHLYYSLTSHFHTGRYHTGNIGQSKIPLSTGQLQEKFHYAILFQSIYKIMPVLNVPHVAKAIAPKKLTDGTTSLS